jgi:hypothetical protein
VAVDLDEGILCCVFRVRAVAQVLIRDAQGSALMQLHETGEERSGSVVVTPVNQVSNLNRQASVIGEHRFDRPTLGGLGGRGHAVGRRILP